jgi:hypothetical protein
MTAKDWTRLCLVGANAAMRAMELELLDPVAQKAAVGDVAGVWPCYAALIALRFGRKVLDRVAARLAPYWELDGVPPEAFLPAELAKATLSPDISRQPDDKGRLIIASEFDAAMSPDGLDGRPFLLVAPDDVSRYNRALTWLKDQGVFDEVLDER